MKLVLTRWVIPLLLLTTLLMGGCATIAIQQGYWSKDPSRPGIYIFGGTIFDIAAVTGAAMAENEASIGTLLIFDLPFSLAADVVLLPLCIYQQIDRASWNNEGTYVAMLANPDERVRERGAIALGDFEPTTRRTIDALTGAITDGSPAVRRAALSSLQRKDPQSLLSGTLAMLLQDSDEGVRIEAANGLGEIGEADPTTVIALQGALKDHEFRVRSTAIRSLGKIGGQDNRTIPTLVVALRDQSPSVRLAAAETLGDIGSKYPAEEALPSLSNALQDQNYRVREAAEKAIFQIKNRY